MTASNPGLLSVSLIVAHLAILTMQITNTTSYKSDKLTNKLQQEQL